MGFAPSGITKLSELTIDVSKDWDANRIRNLLDPALDQDAATKKYHHDNPTGISKLSELEIDADKSWSLKALSRLAGLDVGQVRGDIWIYEYENGEDLIVKRLAAGAEGKVLCSRGPGKPPFWAYLWEEPGGTSSLERYYPALIDLTRSAAIITVDQSQNESAPIVFEYEQAYGDAPTDYIKRLTPALVAPDAEVITAIDQVNNEPGPLVTDYDTDVA